MKFFSLIVLFSLSVHAFGQQAIPKAPVTTEKTYSVSGKWTKLNTNFRFSFTGELNIRDTVLSGYFIWKVESVDPASAAYYRDKMDATAKEYFEGSYDPVSKSAYFFSVREVDFKNIVGPDTYFLEFASNNQFSGQGAGNGDWSGRLNGTYKLEPAAAKTKQPASPLDNTLFTKINVTGKPSQPLKLYDLYQADLTYIRFAYPHGNFSVFNAPGSSLYILDPATGKTYACKDACNIPLNQTISRKNREHVFVLGFERIPDQLTHFEIFEGPSAKDIENNWWLDVNLANASRVKTSAYETDFLALNTFLYRTMPEESDVVFVERKNFIPLREVTPVQRIEDSLGTGNWLPLSQSASAKYFQDNLNFQLEYWEYKGDLQNGWGALRQKGEDLFMVMGKFKNGALNGYGRVQVKRTSGMFPVNVNLEGSFVNNRLHGLGSASRQENMNNKSYSGYFYDGNFLVNKGFGGIDEKGMLYIYVNKGTCKFYPPIRDRSVRFGTYNKYDRIFGADIAFGNSVYGSETLSAIEWTGQCLNGLAHGVGRIHLSGTTSENLTNQAKDFENDIYYGVMVYGDFYDGKLYNFVDLATGLVTGQNARKYIVFERGVFVGEDLTEITRINAEYNKRQSAYEKEQKSLAVNYDLVLSKPGIASVNVINTNNVVAIINVSDGGILGFSDVDTKSYATSVFDNSGKLVKSYNSPFDDHGVGGPRLTKEQLPGKIVVSYKVAGVSKTVTMVVKATGLYDLSLH